MPAKNKPYEQFGDYILFKKLESDALSDLWRAARIENGALGPLVALRRLSGGNREALLVSVAGARQVVSILSGTTFVRDQQIDVINGTPFISHAYAGGRSLRHVVDRARGGTGTTPNPIPIDQAIAIAERVALSLATTADLRSGGERLAHGGLIPQFIWISDDGEIRVAGQQMGRGLVASMPDSTLAAEIGRYFAPEYQTSGQPSKASEVYSLGAILYLLLTGQEPPLATVSSAFSQAVRASKTATGSPMPEDLRTILEKSLALDPATRYVTVADMKQAISGVANSGKYSATTFNLAFYLSHLLKKEIESEAIEREREVKVNVAPYVASLTESPLESATPPAVLATQKKTAARFPRAIAAAAALVAIGIGAWLTLGSKKAEPPGQPIALATAAVVPPARKAPAVVVPEPIVASATPAQSESASTPEAGKAARKKAFEDAVRERLQQEMLKLQAEYTRKLQQEQARNAPILGMTAAAAAVPGEVTDEGSPSASELDLQRRDAARAVDTNAQAQAALAQSQTPPPAITASGSSSPVPAVVQVPELREGDVVDVSLVDNPPRTIREARPVYPPMAARQRIVASILATVLISENGEVLDVKVLKGDARFGFNEAAVRALRAAQYSPAVKDGKRVRTWLPQIIHFRP